MRPQDQKLSEEVLTRVREHTLIRIVDDDDGLRDALKFALEMEGWHVADYSSGRAFLTGDAPSTPGCVVLDIRMPGMSGIEVQHTLIERGIRLPIIFLTGHGDVEMAVSALQEGALDFILKPIDNDRLLASIAWAANESLNHAAPSHTAKNMSALTSRECEVARLIAAGRLNREVAERLGIAVRTVEVHRANILRKLGVKTPEELRAALGEN